MRMYKVEGGVAHFGTDMVLKLSASQVAARAHLLEEVEGGYRPKAPIQFKSGEIIGIDLAPDVLPRPLAVCLVIEGADKTVNKMLAAKIRRPAKKPATA
ncbi:hypothetical protein [Mesorhizobium sp. B1-1-2]|uniref:hypothetical protein n=1 Tax=Mesorhizobium sp. B1-1-2 TaxID=2589982 RepID=UPI00112BC74B|nr:hypothetical protein [Mesorhizobium sp. B1-1-2]TPN79967.1 hypothetical protein FJ985_01670 [Mesorhizobium sp. B1-1-2]